MLLLLISAAGIIGGFILGLHGVARGDAGQLERIFALAFFAMSAAGFVGLYAKRQERKHQELEPL